MSCNRAIIYSEDVRGVEPHYERITAPAIAILRQHGRTGNKFTEDYHEAIPEIDVPFMTRIMCTDEKCQNP